MSKHLDVELDALKEKLKTLTTLIEDTVAKAIVAVEQKNRTLAIEVIETDKKIDLMEVEIEEDCLKILALHQPVAIDLRYIVGVLKVNNDLERIGDLAVNIAERATYMIKHSGVPAPIDFRDMSQKAFSMLERSIECIINMDTQLARRIRKDDEEVDRINRLNYQAVHEAARKDPEHVKCYFQYISVSKCLERIADYTTNIAEDVIYMVDGTIVRHAPEIY